MSARGPSRRRWPTRCRLPAASLIVALRRGGPAASASADRGVAGVQRGCRSALPACRRRLTIANGGREAVIAANCSLSNMPALFRGMLPLAFGAPACSCRLAGRQAFPARRAGAGGRLGCLQRHRGCRSRRAPGPLRARLRNDHLADAGGRARDVPHLVASAIPLAEGLDAPCRKLCV